MEDTRIDEQENIDYGLLEDDGHLPKEDVRKVFRVAMVMNFI